MVCGILMMEDCLCKGVIEMGLLPQDIDILPASDDRVFKLLLTSPEGKPVLMDLISSIIGRPVIDVVVRNNELPAGDTRRESAATGCKL